MHINKLHKPNSVNFMSSFLYIDHTYHYMFWVLLFSYISHIYYVGADKDTII